MTDQQKPMEEANVAFARGPHSLFGPLDDSIDFRVNGEKKIEWMKHARQKGFASLGDYIRMTVEKDIHGQDHLVSMFAAMLGGNGPNVGQAQGGESK
jgi:hypothetical protein